ncbi:hypothetical protein DKX38_025759 [Salix brachista]|uniref:Uncharacterized protein n=1 Tax=Salix brachista TaxID=2182728 RepID=A0A5N5JV66_9ROSI|nr:hypothetical protein DKX38_025759 [Salix brachista]
MHCGLWQCAAGFVHGVACFNSSNPFPEQVIENRCLSLERNDDQLSEWVEHVTEQLIDDLPDMETHATDTRMVDGGNDIVPSSLFGDHFTPKKSMRRSYFDGNGEELRWNNELGAEQTNILEKEGSAGSSMSRIDENDVMNQSIPNPKPCLARRDESTTKIAAVDFQPSRVGCGFCQTDDRTGEFKPDVAPCSIHENGVKERCHSLNAVDVRVQTG